MPQISFVVFGDPVPKARARAGKNGWYTPSKTANYEKTVAWAAKAAGVKPISGPVELDVRFDMPIPKSWPKKRRDAALGNPHTCKPDATNLLKSIEDALNGIAWIDDAQVWAPRAKKEYGNTPRAVVFISW